MSNKKYAMIENYINDFDEGNIDFYSYMRNYDKNLSITLTMNDEELMVDVFYDNDGWYTVRLPLINFNDCYDEEDISLTIIEGMQKVGSEIITDFGNY